jgi:uncharacterized membrane protein YeaQ/YmgE (transglycosylase-associated protein family)
MITGFISWIVLGLIAGFLASMLVNKGGEGVIGDIVLGILGAVIGGWVTSAMGIGGGGLIWSILVATGGAVLLLVVYHAIVGKGRTRPVV